MPVIKIGDRLVGALVVVLGRDHEAVMDDDQLVDVVDRRRHVDRALQVPAQIVAIDKVDLAFDQSFGGSGEILPVS